MGYNPLILTIDPNFLGHPSMDFSGRRNSPWVETKSSTGMRGKKNHCHSRTASSIRMNTKLHNTLKSQDRQTKNTSKSLRMKSYAHSCQIPGLSQLDKKTQLHPLRSSQLYVLRPAYPSYLQDHPSECK